MKKNHLKLITVLRWIFIALCVLMASNYDFVVSIILLLFAAVIALPIKPIKNIWDKILRIEKPKDITVTETNAKWWQFKKKKEQEEQRIIEQKQREFIEKNKIIKML